MQTPTLFSLCQAVRSDEPLTVRLKSFNDTALKNLLPDLYIYPRTIVVVLTPTILSISIVEARLQPFLTQLKGFPYQPTDDLLGRVRQECGERLRLDDYPITRESWEPLRLQYPDLNELVRTMFDVVGQTAWLTLNEYYANGVTSALQALRDRSEPTA